jgi:hypothetical protein
MIRSVPLRRMTANRDKTASPWQSLPGIGPGAGAAIVYAGRSLPSTVTRSQPLSKQVHREPLRQADGPAASTGDHRKRLSGALGLGKPVQHLTLRPGQLAEPLT